MDPASIVAVIGAVAGAAYRSSKALYEFINTVRHAHEDFEELATQLLVLDGVLSALQTNLGGKGHRLKEKQVSCLLEAELTIGKCKETCDAFKIELQKVMSNSQDGKKSLRDGIKRHFKGKTITDFRVLVESYKSSLSLVLHTVCFESISENTKVVEAFGQELQLAKDNIGVHLDDVKSRRDTLLESTSISDDDDIEAGAGVAIEAYQNRLQKPLQLQQAQLAQCMKLVSASIEGVQQAAQEHSYKNIETGERVRQVIGNVGKVSKDSGIHSYEGIKSTGDVRMIAGNTDTEGFAMLMGFKPQTLNFGYPRGHITLPVNPIEQMKIQAPAGPEADGSGSGPAWTGASLPQGYQDLTNQIQNQGCELLNLNRTLGSVDVLFQKSRPSKLGDGSSDTNVDWVESNEGAQLMLFISFQSPVKLHTLQLTSLPPNGDYFPVRPRTIQLYNNQVQNLGFDDAEDIPATQVITLEKEDWNSEGTAKVALRFVKFQKVSSLVIFIQDGADDGERTRLDRVRLIGSIGKGKLREHQTDDKETHGDAVGVDLKAEVLGYPQPLREVLAPFVNDDDTRKQVEQKYMELKNNATLRKESAMSLLDALGSMEDEDEEGLGVAVESPAQDLMTESQDYPQPLREVLSPYLHDDAIRKLIEDKYYKLRDDGNLRRVSAANLLNALGSLDEEGTGLEDSEDQRHEASGDTTGSAPSGGGSGAGGTSPSREGGASGGSGASGSGGGGGASGGNDASGGGEGGGGDGAPGEGTAPGGNAPPQPQVPRFMDWTLKKGYDLPPKDDPNQTQYNLAMAVLQSVELGVQVLGNGGTMKGLLAALYQAFHRRDVLALFRSTNRTIFVTADLPDASPHILDDLEKGLFDTSKFRGYDERLTALTYNDGKGGNGSITLFKLDTWDAGRPNSLHPVAAMDNVFKSVLRKISSEAKDSRKTTLSKPKTKIWEATRQQTNVQQPKLESKPDLTRSPTGGRGLTVGDILKTALSIDRNDLVDRFCATVPQMIAMLHHKASILRVVRSSEIKADEGQGLRSVALDNFPPGSGHDGSNPLIIVLCPIDGDWVKEKLSWK